MLTHGSEKCTGGPTVAIPDQSVLPTGLVTQTTCRCHIWPGGRGGWSCGDEGQVHRGTDAGVIFSNAN